MRYLRTVLLISLLTSQVAHAQSELKAIRMSCDKAVIALSNTATYKSFVLDSPVRVVVDLENVSAKGLSQPESKVACIHAARFAKRGDHGVRVVFEMAEMPKLNSYLIKDGKNGMRLIVDFKNKQAAETKVAKLDSKPVAPVVESKPKEVPAVDTKPKEALPKETPVAEIKPKELPVTDTNPKTVVTHPDLTAPFPKIKKPEKPIDPKNLAAQFAPLQKVSHEKPAVEKVKTEQVQPDVISVRQADNTKSLLPKRKKFVIAIDAGHGGEDPGAMGKRGVREKDVVLQIAKRLVRMINNEPGMQAVMVRKSDYFIELRDRMAIARKEGADLFISVHADAFHHPRAKGASVFVLSERGSSSEAARWLADHENRADLVGGVSLSDKSSTLASVLLDLSQTASSAASMELANHLLQSLGRVSALHRSRVEQAGFMVLKSPDIPSVLVETGFISNPEGERFLNSPHHQEKMAEALLAGIRRYVDSRPYMSLHHETVPINTVRAISKR